MPETPERPELLIYLDVDGVLNPYEAPPHRRPDGYETHRLLPRQAEERHADDPRYAKPKPYRVWLNPHHGPMLSTFAAQHHARLVWATTWEDEANRLIAPGISLESELEVVVLAKRNSADDSHVYFKTPQLVEHAAGRPFVWFDDEIMQPDRDYVRNRHSGHALLQQINPAVGLRYSDLADAEDAVAEWKRKKRDR